MRLGVLDVGSNTIHLQVVDAHPGARPNPTVSHKVELRLTEYLDSENNISEDLLLMTKENQAISNELSIICNERDLLKSSYSEFKPSKRK